MLPDMMVVANGLALAFAMRGEQRCALSFFGDGATSRGDWHEAMNWAVLDRLPVIFILEDNQLAYSTPHERQFAEHPSVRAAAYGMATDTVDGNDVVAVFAATHAARERALAGGGPTLVCATTMRMHGHGAHDDARYVDPALFEYWLERDPIDAYAKTLASSVDLDQMRADVDAEVAAAVDAALASPMPEPSTVSDGVFCETEPEPLGSGALAPWSGYVGARG